MDIEKIARKLEPLRPQEVRHWLRVRDLADPELKDLIDKQIIATADEVLGDHRGKLLLSLPSRTKARGVINLGTILYEQEKWPLGISKGELLQNLAIFGRSGAGKTNVVFHILEQLIEQKIPFLFLDWKRTARHLLPHLKMKANVYTAGRSIAPFIFNPFIPPPGMEHHIYITHLVDVLASAFTLGEGAKSVLQQAIVSCYATGTWPGVEEVLRVVQETETKGRAQGWKDSAVRALQSLSLAKVAGQAGTKQRDLIAALMKANTIVELNGLHQSAKAFLIPMLCLWLYHVKLAESRRERLDLVIVVEEAHHVLYRQEQRTKETVMNMLLRQCREIGIGMIVVDQHPHLVSSAALGNCFTSICLNQKEPTDLNRAAALSLLDETDKKWLSMLPVGQGIVKLQDRWFRPVLVKFPHVAVPKGFVTDEVLSAILEGSVTLSALRRRVNVESGGLGGFRVADTVVEDSAWALLQDVAEHQDDGVDARYKRLGFSGEKGNRLKVNLIAAGILEEQAVRVGRTRRVLLRPTTTAKRELGLTAGNIERGSLVHGYWKRFYARKFKKMGYAVELEAPRRNGRVDVLATKASESVAIEIETGKSDAVSNVKNCLLSGFEKVIVVATDESALRRVDRELARARLVVPGRIEIVLRDRLYSGSGAG